jgi:hypothetical protein
MVTPFWKENNPEGACERLVKESVLLWQREDEVIDDITCLVVFLNVLNGEVTSASAKANPAAAQNFLHDHNSHY